MNEIQFDENRDSFLLLQDYFFIGSENIPSKNIGSSIFIRNDYKCLALLLFNMKDKNIFKSLLCGTPGVGKTIFRNYFAKFILLNVVGNVAIIFDKSPGKKSFLFTRIDGKITCYSAASVDPLLEELFNIETAMPVYCLADVSSGNSDKCVFEFTFENNSVYHFFMFSGPNDNAFAKLRAKRLYLPFWNLEELLEAGKMLPLTYFIEGRINAVYKMVDGPEKTAEINNINIEISTIIRSRFKDYGGNARVILGNQTTYEDHIKERVLKAVNSFDYKTAECIGAISESKHCLLYMKVKNDYTAFEYVWASNYIIDLLSERAFKRLLQYAEDIFISVWEEKSCYRGQLFESICHRIILHSSEPFKVMRLDHKNTSLFSGKSPGYINLSGLTKVSFSRDNAANAISSAPFNSYLVPDDINFPIVDSIAKLHNGVLVFFQMTVAENHAAEPRTNFFSDFIKSLNIGNVFHLVYVCAPSCYKTYEVQKVNIQDVTVYQYSLKVTSN